MQARTHECHSEVQRDNMCQGFGRELSALEVAIAIANSE